MRKLRLSNLHVTECINGGVVLYETAFPSISMAPKAPNINRITQRIENGWSLGGDKTKKGAPLENDSLLVVL
jgi:hypothetical protein